MNWTGGALQRSRSSNAKGATSRTQKQYFTRARQSLLNSPQAPPSIDLSVFQNAKTKEESKKHYQFPAEFSDHSQRTAKEIRDPEPSVIKLQMPRMRDVRGLMTEDQQRSRKQCKADSFLGTDFQSPLRNKDFAVIGPICLEGREVQGSPPRRNLHQFQHGRSASALRRKRMKLLGCRDWAGLEYSKPVKIHFDSIEDKDLIGKRRRIDSEDVERRTARLRNRRFKTLHHLPSKHLFNAVPSNQDVSIHIGSSVPDYASPFHATPQPSTSQDSCLSEDMLLDRTGSSLVSLEKGDPNRQSYRLQESPLRSIPSGLERDAKALIPTLRPIARSSCNEKLEDFSTVDCCAHQQGMPKEATEGIPGPTIEDESDFHGLRLEFESTPEAHLEATDVQSRIIQAPGFNPWPLMHGALVQDEHIADAQELTTPNRDQPQVAEDINLPVNQHQSAKAVPDKDCMSPVNHATVPMSTLSPQTATHGTSDPTQKRPSWEPENEEAVWRRFVFGSQESTSANSQESYIHKVDSHPSSLLMQDTSPFAPSPLLSRHATLHANFSTEALASSVTTTMDQRCPENLWTTSPIKCMSQCNVRPRLSDNRDHSSSALQSSFNVPQSVSTSTISPDSFPPEGRSKTHHSLESLVPSNKGFTAPPTSTQAATCASPFTVSSDELGWSPDRIRQHLIFKKPKRYDGSRIRGREQKLQEDNRASRGDHGSRESMARRIEVEGDHEEDQIEDW